MAPPPLLDPPYRTPARLQRQIGGLPRLRRTAAKQPKSQCCGRRWRAEGVRLHPALGWDSTGPGHFPFMGQFLASWSLPLQMLHRLASGHV